MSNTFGQLFRFTTWGESHGKAIGCVVDGVPANIELCNDDIQCYLDKRRPGQSAFTTGRNEKDQVEILSGIFEGKTTGTPVSLIIYNTDTRSSDYSEVKNKFRPGHADFTYFNKYINYDYRGSGRASARETAMRVAAGAIARKIVKNINIRGALVQIGKYKIDYDNWDWSAVGENKFYCPDKRIVKTWEDYIMQLKESGDSAGAILEVHADNVPVGLGEPIYGKLESLLASAFMGINAVKGVEIGSGFNIVNYQGSDASDQMYDDDGKVKFGTNNAGGIQGGISDGRPIVVRFIVKPTSSIAKVMNTVDRDGNDSTISTKGRHDPCVGIRAVAVGEAMMACVLADCYLLSRAFDHHYFAQC